jgi:uncharacterized protein YndB with AHSA1/START domain
MSELLEPIVVEQTFDVSKETVWEAITQRERMIRWFFADIPDFKPEVGFCTQFNVDAGERNFYHLWTITEVVDGEKIVYDWRYKDYAGQGLVTFEIFARGSGSVLRVTTLGIESFPSDIPEFTRDSCEGGWKYFIQGNLKYYLEPETK